MRCPKCGYISFDHLDNCRKCHKPTAQSEFKGTTYPVLVPIFLQPSQEIPESGFDENMVIDEDMVDVLDPDLDLLAENNDNIAGQSAERDISIGDDFEIAFNAGQNEDALSLDEDDLAIDISRFADVPINMQAVQETQPVQFAIPEGLADISDLARPAAGAESKSKLAVHLGDGDDDLNLDDLNLSLGGEKASVAALAADDDLTLDDLNLSLGGEKVSVAASAADDDKLALLSLDDIDLSGGLEVVPSPRPSQVPSRSVDDELNFDLDLGTLGEEKDRPQKNKSDDLPELTLSLD
jgi:hypothetical protein